MEEEEAVDVLVEEDVWKDLLGKSWQEWPDEQRNLHTEGAQCSLLGRSVGDMNEQELIFFIGFLDKLCSQQNSALHWYVKQEEERKFGEQEAQKARDKEILNAPEGEDEEGATTSPRLDGYQD